MVRGLNCILPVRVFQYPTGTKNTLTMHPAIANNTPRKAIMRDDLDHVRITRSLAMKMGQNKNPPVMTKKSAIELILSYLCRIVNTFFAIQA